MKLTYNLDAKLTASDLKKLESVMGNWRTAFAFMKTLPEDDRGVDFLMKMMHYELFVSKKRRYQMMDRIQMRLNGVRGRIERVRWSPYAPS